MHKSLRLQAGFSLVELSIVLLIVGLLVGGIIGGASSFIQHANSREADRQLDLIRESLIGFLVENGRLPCADSDGDGLEEGPDPCEGWGEPPYAQLGVPRRDPWGGTYRYRIAIAFAGENLPDSQSSFALDTNGNIDVRDAPACGGNTIAVGMAAIVVSEGANRGNGSSDEDENIDDNNCFVLKAYSTTPGSEFDDRLMWISPAILKAKLVEVDKLP
ncbi:MAG TPA: type II secretion system protein GspG [Gammaproteobacteria bacterium]